MHQVVPLLLHLPNHVRHGPASGDEGQHVLGVRGDHVEDVGGPGRQHALQGGLEVPPVDNPLAGDVEAGADPHVVGVNLRAVVRVAEVSVAAVAFVEVVLPLHDHAEVLVVEDDRLGGNLLDVRRGQLLDVHQERTVAVDIDHFLVRMGNLDAQRRRIPKAHRAQSGTGDELAGTCTYTTGPTTSGAGPRPW